MKRSSLVLPLLTVCLLHSGCSLLGDKDDRMPGIIVYQITSDMEAAVSSVRGDGLTVPNSTYPPEAPVLEAPETVVAGQPFDVVVRTYGSSGCWAAAGADLKMQEMQAVVTPYDEDGQRAGYMCTTEVIRLPRTISITFPTPGEATIRVEGRVVQMSDGEVLTETMGQIELQVTVQ